MTFKVSYLNMAEALFRGDLDFRMILRNTDTLGQCFSEFSIKHSGALKSLLGGGDGNGV